MVQVLGALGKRLWNAGKTYLRGKHCSEEEEVRAMLKELAGEQGMEDDEDTINGDDKAHTELQTIFNTLKEVEVKVMQDDSTDDTAKAEGLFGSIKCWAWKKLKRWAGKKFKSWAGRKIRGATRKFLC